jgi:hypothetical protein
VVLTGDSIGHTPPGGNSPNVTVSLEPATLEATGPALSSRAYALALALPLAWNAVCPGQRPHVTCERDPWASGQSRYHPAVPDLWSTPDKEIHLLLSAALLLAAERGGVPPGRAALLTLTAGAALEYTQGYVSRRDLAADAIGVATAYGWIRYCRWSSQRLARSAGALMGAALPH